MSRHADNSWQTIYSAGYWTRPLCNEVSGLPVTYRTMNSVRCEWQVWNLGSQNVVRGILILHKLMSRVMILATLVNQPPRKWTSSNGHTNVPGFFYALLTVHPPIIFFKWSQLGAHYFLVYLFQLLCMFRVTMCPSSGELTVSVRHWYFSLCMVGCLVCRPDKIYQCRIDTVSSPDDGHLVARNM